MNVRIPANENNKSNGNNSHGFSESNIFMDKIYKKAQYGFFKLIPYIFYKSKINKFIKNIDKSSPNFDMLWNMADFIKMAELVFCYDNSITNTDIGLYSSKNYNEGTNGFKITESNCIITIKLFAKSEQVALEIEHLNGENMRTTINFKNSQWQHTPSKFDEMILEQVIKSINSRIIRLFQYCYNLR